MMTTSRRQASASTDFFARSVLFWTTAGLLWSLLLLATGVAEELAKPSRLHLPFWDQEDVREVVGQLNFRAEPLQKEGLAAGYPAMLYGCEVPLEDGNAWVYGWKLTNWQERSTRTVEVVRAMTRDGKTFTAEETVLSVVNPDWQGFANIVRRATDGRLFFFCWSAGHLQVYSSDNGQQWTRLTESAYVEHDAMHVIWYPPLQEFVNFQNTLEKYAKRYPDNIGQYRRVLSFRRSKDGVQWDWFSPPFLQGSRHWTPDEHDPMDLEFYRSIVFPTQGRYAMLLQDYIAPPPEANSRRKTTKHGPRSEVEWATSRDGLNWARLHRDQDATAPGLGSGRAGTVRAGWGDAILRARSGDLQPCRRQVLFRHGSRKL